MKIINKKRMSLLLSVMFFSLIMFSGISKTLNAEASPVEKSTDIKSKALLNNSGEIVILETNSVTTGAAIGVVVSDVSDENLVTTGTAIHLSMTTTNSAISLDTEGAVIIFTTNGTEPTVDNATVYNEEIVINDNVVIKARIHQNSQYSEIAEFNYEVMQVETVTSSVPSGSVAMGVEVELSTKTTGAAIYYEVVEKDFMTTTPQVIKYEGPISIERSQIIRTFAQKEGHKQSELAEYTFEINDQIVIVRETSNDIKAETFAEFPIKVRNKLTRAKHVSLVIAVYDENDVMIDYLYVNDKLVPGEATEIYGGLKITDSASYVKSYLIDTIEGIRPVSNTIKIPVQK